jgi:hypothetical protein
MPVVLTTQEAEIRRIEVQSQPGQNSLWDCLEKKKYQKKGWWSGSRCRPWVQTPVLQKPNQTIPETIPDLLDKAWIENVPTTDFVLFVLHAKERTHIFSFEQNGLHQVRDRLTRVWSILHRVPYLVYFYYLFNLHFWIRSSVFLFCKKLCSRYWKSGHT